MVRIGTVWDSTVEVLAGRSGLIVPIALAALYLPGLVQNALTFAFPPQSIAAVVLGVAFALAVGIASIWGQLAIIAVSTDPATTTRDAAAQANARLLPVIGVALVITVAAALLFAPIPIALAASGFDWQRFVAAQGNRALMPPLSPGVAGFVLLYAVALLLVALWAGARLLLTYAVVLNERRGLGAIGRSIALTRGSTWRLIGTILLFGVSAGVSVVAVRSVVGIVARLVMGPAHVAGALFVAAIVAALVSTAFTALAYVFIARFYVAARAEEGGVEPA